MVDVLVFDVDGVLAEVTESYRETVVQTVRHFSGQTIPRDRIQDYKNQGGWNNDWALSQRILRDLGHEISYQTVVDQFNRLFLGHNGVEGLIYREKWIPRPGLLESLAEEYELSVFTGRLRHELDITFGRFAKNLVFDPIICAEDVRSPKPEPEGLLTIAARHPGKRLLYFGDTVDDARSARAAGIPFVGIAAPDHSRRAEILELFEREEAIAILPDVNEIPNLMNRWPTGHELRATS